MRGGDGSVATIIPFFTLKKQEYIVYKKRQKRGKKTLKGSESEKKIKRVQERIIFLVCVGF